MLNGGDSGGPWTTTKINNAKAQIDTWIAGLKRRLGVNWDNALTIARRVNNDVLPLLRMIADAGLSEIPSSRTELLDLAIGDRSSWPQSRLTQTKEIIDDLRKTEKVDLQELMTKVTDRLSLVGPPLRLLQHITEDGDLNDKFGNRWKSDRVAAVLNKRENNSFWTPAKVEEAGDMLKAWLRAADKLGFDVYNLDDLFSRVAVVGAKNHVN